MSLAVLLAIWMVLLTFWLHYRSLLWISRFVPAYGLQPQARVLVIVLLIFAVHLFEIALYATAYYVAVAFLNLGSLHLNPLAGLPLSGFMEYFYYSAVAYTSLALGDVYPAGHVRFLTGVETLNGLVLIAWSGSFTFLVMGHLWPWQGCTPLSPEEDNKDDR